MTRATKSTLNKLVKYNQSDDMTHYRQTVILTNMIKWANMENCEDAFYTGTYLYYKCPESDKPVMRGLESKYPKLIRTTLTNGLNEVIIYDVNKLVKEILEP